MKYFICVGHANYGGGVISSADGTSKGGVNEYKYNKELAPYVCKWLKVAGHEATLCIAPEGQLHSLDDEIKYFIKEEHKQNYDLSVQLHLNAFNGEAYGCLACCYNANGLPEAQRISAKLGTVWHNRGAEVRPGLYWTRKTKAKAVLVESFFCDNKDDYAKAKKLGMDAHGKLIAEGIIGKDIVAKPKAKYYIQEDGGWTTGKLLATKELWLAAITTGFFQICSVGVMSQLVIRNTQLGFSQQAAMNVMTILALGGVVGSWLVGVIDDAIGTKKTMVMFGIWYAIALLLNFTAVDSVTPLVYVSLFMIAMGIGGSANFTTSLPTSIFGRQGFDKVNSVIFPIQGAVTALCFLVNGVVQKITGGQIRMAYLVFAGVALVNVLLVLMVNEHKYNRDWMAAHKK